MKQSLPHLLIVMLTLLLTFNDVMASKAIALTLKVEGEIQHKKDGEQKPKKLTFGTALDHGDWIKTGGDGFCVLVFTDDKSQIKILANTEVVIEGRRDDQSNIAKRVSMEVGEIFAKVERQRGSLQVATPTSVASVKGTEFWVVVLDDGTTEIVTLEGLVELVNRFSGQITEVRQGQQGRSNPDGNVENNDVDLGEWRDPENRNGDGDNGEGGDGEGNDQEPRSMKLEFEDKDGKPKVIEIQFTN